MFHVIKVRIYEERGWGWASPLVYTVTRTRHTDTVAQAIRSVLAYEQKRMLRNGASRWDMEVIP